MFFTVRKIDGFVINIEDFSSDEELLKEIVEFLKPRYRLAFVGQDTARDYTHLGISASDVFFPKTVFEASIYQNVIRRAIAHIGTTPSTTAFLCRDGAQLRSAHEVLLGTIVMLSATASDYDKVHIFQEFPDFIVRSVKDLENCLSGTDVGFGGEYFASPPGVFIFAKQDVRTCSFPSVPNTEHPDCPVYVAGRYFASGDPRHQLHALSTRIVKSKSNPQGQAKCFAVLYMRGSWWASGGQIDYITRVPARPGDVDRLIIYMNEIPNTLDFKENQLQQAILRPDILECIRKYPKLKALNYQQRKSAVQGAFRASPDVQGKRIVLLDDVQTTGATLNECIRTLKDAGAASVLPLVLGYHPYTLQTLGLTDDHELHCSACSKVLIGRCNRNDGTPFYGCSGWSPGDGVSHTQKTFSTGLSDKLKLMESKLMQPDEELQSEDIWF